MEWVCAILAITLVACTTLIATTTIADRYRDSVHDQLSRLMLIVIRAMQSVLTSTQLS